MKRFMRANHMPILALADQQIERKLTARPGVRAGNASDDEPRYPPDSLGALLSSAKKARGRAPSVVAFTDPNDLLSFILVPSPHRQWYDYAVVDAITSNADTWPGFIERPNHAHPRYVRNRTVRETIACGKPKDLRCTD